MKEWVAECIKILTIFIQDLNDFQTLYKKIISYIIVSLTLNYFNLLNLINDLTSSYYLLIILGGIVAIFTSFISLKTISSKFISGIIKEFTQIVFTGLGILYFSIIISTIQSFHFDKIILLLNLFPILIIVKLFLALVKYFENPELYS